MFDEAQELGNVAKNGDLEECSYFHHLRLVLKEIVLHPVFSVFISTTPNFWSVPPPIQSHLLLDLQLHPPITELPFDIFARDLDENRRYTLNAVCSADVMARFGRPM